MRKKSDLCGDFGAHLLCEGVVAVPKMLLRNFTRIGLQEGDFVLILHLICLRNSRPYPSTGELAELIGVGVERVENMLGRMMEEGFLSVENIYVPETGGLTPAYSLGGLMEKLSEIWAQEKAQGIEASNKVSKRQESVKNRVSGGIRPLIKSFEEEFGRPLTEIECSNIIEWHEGCEFPQELIQEALKRAVLNQTPNWRYINSILREWNKKNLKTLQEVFEDDARFQARQNQFKAGAKAKITAKGSTLKDKYKDIYL